MIDSKGSVVVGGQGSHDRLAGVPVVPDRGGQGEDALQDPHGDAGDGPAAVLFEVELAFEGLVDRFDARPDGRSRPRPGRAGSVRFAGRTTVIPLSLSQVSMSRSRYPLSTTRISPSGWWNMLGCRVTRSTRTSRSSVLALLSANATGRPCTVVTRCSRRPQNSRECEAQ